MNQNTLKLKVLFSSGLILAFSIAVVAPEMFNHFVAIALCLTLSYALLQVQTLFMHHFVFKGYLLPEKKTKAATKIIVTDEFQTRFKWCSEVNYDNYEIPTHLRKQ
jgi:hypothetical protein